jgi:hypothetical protein
VRIVTVARKPRASSSTTANVIEHEAGALNVDACRIGYASADDLRETLSRNPGTDRRFTSNLYDTESETRPMQRTNPTGRWPANVILLHRPGCKIVGTRKVDTGVAVRRHVGHSTKGLISYARGTKDAEMRDDVTYADADGKENIPDWSCEPGCPVAELDRQSGTLTSGSGTVKRASSAQREGNQGAAYGAENRADGTPMIWYGDTGGASRFFKGFGGQGSEG